MKRKPLKGRPPLPKEEYRERAFTALNESERAMIEEIAALRKTTLAAARRSALIEGAEAILARERGR